jgi:hypothetical protein
MTCLKELIPVLELDVFFEGSVGSIGIEVDI